MGKRIIQLLLSLAATVVGAIPALMFLGARSMLSPEGFLQNFFVFGVGVWLLGGVQIFFLIGWIVALFFIWAMD